MGKKKDKKKARSNDSRTAGSLRDSPAKATGHLSDQAAEDDEILDAYVPDFDLDVALSLHAPVDWMDTYDREYLETAISEGRQLPLVVISVDIRRSTFLMKESLQLTEFAEILNRFVTTSSSIIRHSGGFFDKFLGDGFLAYWLGGPQLHEPRARHASLGPAQGVHFAFDAIDCVAEIHKLFETHVVSDLRSNVRNLPAGTGLSAGIDGGYGQLVQIAGDLTVVGSPVVGAVRMVTAASEPGETVANVFLGEVLHKDPDGCLERGYRVEREFRPTKEYREGQEVYSVRFC